MRINLHVLPIRDKDFGLCVARLDKESMKKLHVKRGDTIVISGKRKTAATVRDYYRKTKEKNAIWIDSFTRKNAGTTLSSIVTVARPAKVKDAKAIALAPIDMRLNVDEDFTNFVKNRIIERPLSEGDRTIVFMLGHGIPFLVHRTEPRAECVLMVKKTRLFIHQKPIPVSETAFTDIKLLLRHDWLDFVSSRIGARKHTFRIVGSREEEESEKRILESAKTLRGESWEPNELDIVVSFYSEKDDVIGTFPWVSLDVYGELTAVYPDIQFPPSPRNIQDMSNEMRTSASIMRRCFKTGLKKCPKKISFSPKTVFVAMPFQPKYQDLYKYAIRPALEEMELQIWKADEKLSNIDVMCKICQGVQECGYIISNITDWNANVLFEMGLAYGLGKNVVLIKDRRENVPVDLKGLEYIDYENIDELKRNIVAFFMSIKHGS